MASLKKRPRAKSARERPVIYENSRYDEVGKTEQLIIGHYLESLHDPTRKMRPKSSKPKLSSRSEPSLQIRRFASQPSLYEQEHPRTQKLTGTVAKKTIKEMGPYAWTPLATRTAVGYGEDPYLVNSKQHKMNHRPTSAPASKMRRTGSFSSMDTSSSVSLTASLVTSHASTRRRSKKGYLEEAETLCVRAFLNGSKERSVRVVAKSLAQLLAEATEKLGLPSAGRKIFLQDGELVTSPHQLYKDCTVYVSMGDSFKDPYEALRENERIRLQSSWTLLGITLPEKKNTGKKVTLSKRMKDLAESHRHKILVFRNGESAEGIEIVANRFDGFLNDCTGKLGLMSGARTLYDWQGNEVRSFSDVPVMDEALQMSGGWKQGPIWVSRGERFSPSGAYDFFKSVALSFKESMNRVEQGLELYKSRQKGEHVDVPTIMSLSDAEIDKHIILITKAIEREKHEFKRLKGQIKTLKDMRKEEATVGNSYKFQHIAEVGQNSRLVGTKGYRLKVRLNGNVDSEAITMHFSTKDLCKGKNTQEQQLQRFFDLLNSNASLKECFIGHGRRAVFKRAFLANGSEINDISNIDNDAEVWLSLGEDFVPFEYDIIGIATYKVRLIDFWNQKSVLQREPWLGADEKSAKPSLWTATTTLSMNDIERQEIPETTVEEEKMRLVQSVNESRLRTDELFLQNKKDEKLALYPDVQMIQKGREQDLDLWGEDASQWIFNQDGTITNKQFRNLVLSVKEQAIIFVNGEEKIEGYGVGLAVKEIQRFLQEKKEGEGENLTSTATNPRQKWKLTSDGQIASVMSPDLFLTSLNDLKIEVPLPPEENVLPPEENVLPPEENVELKEVVPPKLTSSSSSSSSESSRENGEDDGEKMKKKKKKKLKKKQKEKKKKKKKWWNFGSSSSSESGDSENELGKEKTKSFDDIRVRMKGTSSEDDKASAKEKTAEDKESGLETRERTEGDKDGANGDEEGAEQGGEKAKTADDLLKELPDFYGGQRFLLGVFPKFGDKDPLKIRQRWAVKREESASLISSSTLTDKWLRQGLAWPVNEAETWVEDLIDGYLLPCAPKLKRKQLMKEKTSSPFYGQPARLKVLKNGEHDSSRAVIVVGPDLSNMTRKVRASLPLKWRKENGEFQDVQAASPSEVEFEQFLDRCTDSLGLPFAARRMFDEKGKELFSVGGLERDQIVYVSSGDAWINPDVTYSEQQRRVLLANLASDVTKMRNYVTLREQSDFILQVDGPLQAGSGISLHKRATDEDSLNGDGSECSMSQDETKQENEMNDLHSSFLTSHQIAHMKAEERLQSIRERLEVADSGLISDKSTADDSGEDSPFSNPALARKFSPSVEPTAKLSPNLFRRWAFNDGFIHLKANKKLVLGVEQNDESTSGQEVIICNKKLEDSFQRWVLSDLGYIHLKCNPQPVLTVATPPLKTDPFSDSSDSIGYLSSRIILGRRLDCFNGNSHQMFSLENDTGLISAFATDLTNTEVTSAIKASVCTYSVLGSKETYQPGYTVLDGVESKTSVHVCESCGKAIRGKLKLQRNAEMIEFSCAMGTPEKFELTTAGSFKCLTSQVDLSYREAESTLLVWEMQLKRLQKESSVRVIAYELNLAQTTPSVRISAHRNGDSNYNEGVVVIGNSINQFLDLCTYKLGLTQAARKMYTMDGELITDMSQLLQPYYPQLCMPIQQSASFKKIDSPQPADQQKSDEGRGIPPSDTSSEISDRTFTIQNRDSPENRAHSSLSLTSERHVSFADQPVQLEEEKIEFPKLERMDVRVPIDVWVSCGEPFIPFQESEKRAMRAAQEREERAIVSNYLEQEKHRLRQMQGRRYSGRSCLQGNDGLVKPVLSKVWDAPSKEEDVLEKSIEDLQVHLSELKVQQEQDQLTEINKSRPRSARISERMKESKLYELPHGLSIVVFPNGESPDRAVPVIATTFAEFLNRATSRLNLTSAARRAFTTDGVEIFSLDFIEKNQLICVSCGEKFVPSRDRRHKIEMRASWSRMNRSNGTKASNGKSEGVLALTAPPTPVSGRNSPMSRKPKHEETLHIFGKDKPGPLSPSRPTSARPTSARPTSARPTSSRSKSLQSPKIVSRTTVKS